MLSFGSEQLYGTPSLARRQLRLRVHVRWSALSRWQRPTHGLNARTMAGQCGSASIVLTSPSIVGARFIAMLAIGRRRASRSSTRHAAAAASDDATRPLSPQSAGSNVSARMASARSGRRRCALMLAPRSGSEARSWLPEKQTAALSRGIGVRRLVLAAWHGKHFANA